MIIFNSICSTRRLCNFLVLILATLDVSVEVASFCQFDRFNIRIRNFQATKQLKHRKLVRGSIGGSSNSSTRSSGGDSSLCLSVKRKEASYKNFDEFLTQQECDITADSLTAVTFASPFCGPCKRMKEELVSVKKSMGELVNLVAIDSNKYPALSCRYNITGEEALVKSFILFQSTTSQRIR